LRCSIGNALASNLEAWLRAYDLLWLDKKFAGLRNHLRDDVVFVLPGFNRRSIGIDAALEGYRSFAESSKIARYETYDYHFTGRSGVIVADYAWTMKWRSEGVDHLERGAKY